jgi:RNA polymerase sigma factor (sigma-70 family)
MAHAAQTSPDADVPLAARLEALHEASFGWACSCCDGDRDEAADVLQTCYVKVLTGRAEFGGQSSFRTWFFGVVRFTALESRRRGARALTLAGLQDPGPEPAQPDAALLEAEQGERLRDALAQLPARQRDVLHLVFYQGLSVTEAATVLELSVGSVRVHYDRGKKRMRALLASFRPEFDLDTEAQDHG